jgi:hypothetical protein
MSKKILIGYVVFVHICLLFVLIKSDFITRIGYRIGLVENLQPEITQHFKEMLRYHERIDPHIPEGAVIFIGDSLTQGLYTSAVLPLR